MIGEKTVLDQAKVEMISQGDQKFLQSAFDADPSHFLHEYIEERKIIDTLREDMKTYQATIRALESEAFEEPELVYLPGTLSLISSENRQDRLTKLEAELNDVQAEIQRRGPQLLARMKALLDPENKKKLSELEYIKARLDEVEGIQR